MLGSSKGDFTHTTGDLRRGHGHAEPTIRVGKTTASEEILHSG